MDCVAQFVRFDVSVPTRSASYISTTSGRARVGQTGFLASGLGFFFLAGTSTYSSSFGKALGLFISDFLAAVSCGLMVSSLGRFRRSGILHTTICGAVWHPSSLKLLTFWARASSPSYQEPIPADCQMIRPSPSCVRYLGGVASIRATLQLHPLSMAGTCFFFIL